MKKIIFISMLFVTIFSVTGCGNDETSSKEADGDENGKGSVSNGNMSYDESAENKLAFFTNSGCKYKDVTRADSQQERIVYEATSDGGLMVSHNNISYCCVAEISSMASVQDHVIKIYEKAEHNSDVDCVCPYDLMMKVGGLTQGSYTLMIGGNACHTISIPIEYSPDLKSEFVVVK